VSDNEAVKVLVVDDHAAVRAAIANLIDTEHPRLRVVGTAASADEALDQADSQQPHVVVLDANLGTEDGLALIPALRRAAPCKVVVLSSLTDPALAAHAERLGAHACLHKMAPAAELLSCIAAAHGAEDTTIVGARDTKQRGRSNAMNQGLNKFATSASQFLRSDDGVTAIEYGLLAALILIVCIAAFSATGDSLTDIYMRWSTAVIDALQ
jgi:DNA-binding NarL/FixJ family response regulator